MATLYGTVRDTISFRPVPTELTVIPIIPSKEGLRDAYHVRLGPNCFGQMVNKQLVLHGLETIHTDIRFVAEMFTEAQGLVTLKNPFSGRLCLCNTVWWADFAISKHLRKKLQEVCVEVYLYDVNDELIPDDWVRDRCTAFQFLAGAEEAVAFGEALMIELIEAWRQRKALGISIGDDDEWPSYFEADPKWSDYFDKP